MVYTKQYETKWHDTDATLTLRPSAVLSYFEETSALQQRSVGRSLDEVREREGIAFILSRIGIEFYQPVAPFRTVEVKTWTNESRGFSSPRHFEMWDGGTLAAAATSIWALVDLGAHKPIRVSAFEFGFTHEEKEIEGLSARVLIPRGTTFEEVGTRRIGYSEVDYNRHMNNTRYPDMLLDFLPDPEKARMRRLTMSFLHEAPLGATLRVLRTATENGFLFRTEDEEGQTCLEAEVLTSWR